MWTQTQVLLLSLILGFIQLDTFSRCLFYNIQCPTKNQESRLTEETKEDTFPFTTTVTLTEKGEKVICLKLRNS